MKLNPRSELKVKDGKEKAKNVTPDSPPLGRIFNAVRGLKFSYLAGYI